MHPTRAIGGEPADGDHAVDVGMVQQILPPRVEHAEKSDRGAEMCRGRGDFEQRRRARSKQQIVHELLVLERQPRQFVRQRKDDVMLADRQEFILTRREPLVARRRETFRAVAIPTRVVRDGAVIAGHAAIEMATERGRAAARQRAKHAPMLRRQPRAVYLDEAIAVLSDDVGHLEGWPGHRRSSRRDRRAASGVDSGMASNGLTTAWRCRRERWR